jgi:anti-sigma regulatory factor (Ser/Thr protein kinase)
MHNVHVRLRAVHIWCVADLGSASLMRMTSTETVISVGLVKGAAGAPHSKRWRRLLCSGPWLPPDRSRVHMLPGDARAASIARVVVGGTCRRWGLGSLAETACLCVSELATNAAMHTDWRPRPVLGQVAMLMVEIVGPFLLVEVRDPDERLPVVGSGFDTVEDSESGRGLLIVCTLVELAGGYYGAVVLPGGGKSVFFALPTGVDGVRDG